LAKDPAKLARIQAQVKAPWKDAAVMNLTRWALWNNVKEFGLPMPVGNEAQTQDNRSKLDIPKTHALDAARLARELLPNQSGLIHCLSKPPHST
jgi:hypothetical protein